MDDQAEHHTFKAGGGWGNCNVLGDPIGDREDNVRRVHGFLSVDLLFSGVRFPQVGDHLEVRMQSGKVAVFEFIEVKRAGDPPDMYTGSVKGLDYRDEVTNRYPYMAGEERRW
jgi:hypothetical protein